jgi:predicted GH43/DUF377 family glycosyl hydrolase
MNRELLARHPANPILKPEDLPFLCNAIYNPGAARMGDRIVLMPRVEDGRRDNRLHVAWSHDGVHFDVEPKPIRIAPSPYDDPTEYHLYDPRITFLDGAYYVTYCSQNFGEIVRIGLLRTSDFRSFERLPFITSPWGRNCALFPEKIRGNYCRIERPMSGNDVVNLISYSRTLCIGGAGNPSSWFRRRGCGRNGVAAPRRSRHPMAGCRSFTGSGWPAIMCIASG